LVNKGKIGGQFTRRYKIKEIEVIVNIVKIFGQCEDICHYFKGNIFCHIGRKMIKCRAHYHLPTPRIWKIEVKKGQIWKYSPLVSKWTR
jgi:hypothetical protein